MPENLAATVFVALIGGGLVSSKNLLMSRKQILTGLEVQGAPKEAVERPIHLSETVTRRWIY